MEPISPERWQQIEALLDQVLEHPPAQRRAFLDHRCADDPELRKQLERVLGAGEAPESFLEDSDGQHFAAMLEDLDLAADPQATEHTTGQHIGPYRLIRPIGRGGMGQVYLAMRDDQSFKRYVALKVIRRGLDTEDILRRFRIERQILASLAHPNIARLLDGGATDDGVSYFVMEYIEGVPIERYCDTHRLSVDERLRLFQRVCAAVHYAHQNLIVHRDLKPSNILVTAEGVPKLLDFGIAKFLNPNLSGYTVPMTRTEMRVMTPEYAAPEQVRGEAVTTATDVYTLGVMLYELLTGHRPYQLRGRGRAEWERVICEMEPEAPSTAVGRSDERHRSDGTTQEITPELVNQARGTQTERLQRRLRGDLDTMVLKALRKEPERRYASAEAFLEDIRRHLAGLPVSAQRDTLGYRVRKFVGRHRVGVTMAVVFVALLVTVALMTTVQARRIASEAAKSDRVREFVVRLFEVSDPDNVEDQDITALELLDRGVERLEELEKEPEVQAQMLNVLGVIYRKLGKYKKAQPLLEQSLALHREVFGKEHTTIAQSLYELASLHQKIGAYDEAEQLHSEALAMRRKLLGNAHPDVAKSTNSLAIILARKGAYEEAEALFQEALTMRYKLFGDEHPSIASAINNLGLMQWQQRNFDAAEPLLREAFEMRRKLLGPKHPDSIGSLNNLGALLYTKEDYDAAEPLYREALTLCREIFGEEHPETANSLNNLGQLLLSMDTFEEAEQLLRESLAIKNKLVEDPHPEIANSLYNLGLLYQKKGAYKEAEPFLRRALAMFRAALPEGHLFIGGNAFTLGELLLDLDRPDEAEPLLREAFEIHLEVFGETKGLTTDVKRSLGSCLTTLARHEEAEPLLIDSYTFYKNEPDQEEAQKALEAIIDLYTAWGKPELVAAYQDSLALSPAP